MLLDKIFVEIGHLKNVALILLEIPRLRREGKHGGMSTRDGRNEIQQEKSGLKLLVSIHLRSSSSSTNNSFLHTSS